MKKDALSLVMLAATVVAAVSAIAAVVFGFDFRTATWVHLILAAVGAVGYIWRQFTVDLRAGRVTPHLMALFVFAFVNYFSLPFTMTNNSFVWLQVPLVLLASCVAGIAYLWVRAPMRSAA